LNTTNPTEEQSGLIFLIGFMGTGKTHWGRIWAARNHYAFLDLDELIEQEEQATVEKIFEKKGEDYFRQQEAKQLRLMGQYKNTIIACGGGAACFHDNISWMNEHGVSVCLTASAKFILKNILRQLPKRPLLKNLNETELLFFIEQKLKERQPFYNLATLTLNAESVSDISIDYLVVPN
jgi:shikimate kinase